MTSKRVKDNTSQKFLETFKEINVYLKKFNIKAWMDAGLLLKFSRGESIFPSSDIDFGVQNKDVSNLLLFAEFIKKKGYKVKSLGNTAVIFEGLTIIKKVRKDIFITVDIYIYYSINNYFFRPNCHKPLKQSNLATNLFRFFNKVNIVLLSNFLQKRPKLKSLMVFFSKIYSRLYFQLSITSQFAIPNHLLENYKKIKIYDESVLIPKNNLAYMEWRYGPNWKIPNKNWRLTDGNMVFLSNLRNYWKYFNVAPDFFQSKFSPKKIVSNKKSIFRFNKEELKIIKKSKIKSELYKNNL